MAKVNTLFSYFAKTPSPKTAKKNELKRSEVLSPHKNGNTISGKTASTNKIKAKPKSMEESKCPFELYELVWAKLEGYPWWPSMVTKHPKTQRCTKTERNQTYIHVQFFDDPPSRGWVKVNHYCCFGHIISIFETKYNLQSPIQVQVVRAFRKGGQFYSADPRCKDAASEADKTMKMEKEERSSLVVAMETSDEEEDMDVDDEIDEHNSSKENAETPEQSPRKTTSKESSHSSTRSRPAKRRRIIIASDSEEEESGIDTSFLVKIPDSSLNFADTLLPSDGDEFKPPASDEDDDDVSSGIDEAEVSDIESTSEPDTPVKKRKRSPVEKKAKKSESFLTPAVPKSGSTNKVSTPGISEKTKSKLSLFTAPTESVVASSGVEGRTFPHMSHDFLQPDQIKDRDGNRKDSPDYSPQTLYVPDSFLNKQTPAMRQWWEMKSRHFDTILFFKMGKFYELFHMDAVIAVNEMGLIYMKGEHAHSGFPEISYGRYAECLIQKGYKVARIEQTETPDMVAERCKQMTKSTKFDKVVKREICSIQTKGTKRYSFIDGDSTDASSSYLLAICERVDADCGSGQTYGVCFVDTSIGKFYVGQFEDDRHSSRLRTLIAHYPPAQVLTERGKLSEITRTLLTNSLPSAIHETLKSGTEFWDSTKTLKTLTESDYFKQEADPDNKVKWPETLKDLLAEDDSLCHTPAAGCEMAVHALGAIICNTGTTEGTLLERLDNCSTPFGKRLLKQWLCAPLCNPDAINDRLDAVDDLLSVPDITAEVKELLKKMPDLDRLLNKIHTLGSVNRSKNHPDGRAIFFEDLVYSKRKIEDFLSALTGFQSAVNVVEKFAGKSQQLKSRLLKQTVMVAVKTNDEGRFPCLKDELEFFTSAFDHQKARAEGVIKPSPGVDNEYDSAMEDIRMSNRELQEYLDAQKKRIGCRSITYWGTARNRFQMEVPDSVRHVPDEYEVTSSKKGFKRYKTVEIERLFSKLTDAEDRRDVALKDVMRRIFYNFDKSYEKWSGAVQCIAVLDVLINLSHYSHCGDGIMCRPQFVIPSHDKQDLENDPDDLHHHSSVVLVTGPNMGGKSTLMRQVGIIAVMAQLGCYVPAEKCILTPVDRVFTRLGATDRIMAGESTFFVELSETSSILRHATKHSLVLLDELGRGTATYDGTAIACAVVRELSETIHCRTLFSTHYHSLVELFSHDPNVRLGHMACMVENENEEDPTQETITFLYKFVKGACPKSYGFNAARLANIPDDVICVAHKKAKEFQQSLDRLKHFRSLCQTKMSSIKKLQELQELIN
ncbi:hypothetical protein LSH36_40g05016 [Paralvinella palmiformis]|uniref:DNA mismatch repair protein n=1 Tax=Paralvinella palmiformis TaxID=53620 RepID=A0AAD9K7C3_9ANNE|nr:hypothetical protein LSH36_40g05016 [Paralvinella palmiformis]